MILLKDISLYFTETVCFEDFNARIEGGDRIVVTGNNGSGKSSLLKVIKGDMEPSSGAVVCSNETVRGYVPQVLNAFTNLSGAEQFNRLLSAALASGPDILLLDEPTNHLDSKNRKSLLRMLDNYGGALVVVSHDEELLRAIGGRVWNIHDGRIDIFNGGYDNYIGTKRMESLARKEELHLLSKEKKENHQKLMKEQERAKKSKERGEKLAAQKRWLPALANQKAGDAAKNAGKKKSAMYERRSEAQTRFAGLSVPKTGNFTFSLSAHEIKNKTVLSISDGIVKYGDKIILRDINISVSGGAHIAVLGANGAGKTTLFRAILNYPEITKEGVWRAPVPGETGYLDQHYGGLNGKETVFETASRAAPEKSAEEIRDFLSGFLFYTGGEVNKKNAVLSGGERARLSLAKIALATPKLLLLDEITNNIDLETKKYVTGVQREYPGAMMIISHDEAFLSDLNIDDFLRC